MVLVMEYLPLTLYDMLHDVDYILKHSEVKMYAKTILRGLKYMHENSIMHRVRTFNYSQEILDVSILPL